MIKLVISLRINTHKKFSKLNYENLSWNLFENSGLGHVFRINQVCEHGKMKQTGSSSRKIFSEY